VITGSEKAFAAGADIKEMSSKSYPDMFKSDFFAGEAEAVARCRKPVIAAVSGFALGGGCELAMMCDFIIASETAKFGQPEINLGVAPGIGGTQRMTRAVGKAKAMDLMLTGRMMDATEAERSGLVSRVVAADKLMDEAMSAGCSTASSPSPTRRRGWPPSWRSANPSSRASRGDEGARIAEAGSASLTRGLSFVISARFAPGPAGRDINRELTYGQYPGRP
jgi:enoyl-CoA hydratase/carnithine racemase